MEVENLRICEVLSVPREIILSKATSSVDVLPESVEACAAESTSVPGSLSTSEEVNMEQIAVYDNENNSLLNPVTHVDARPNLGSPLKFEKENLLLNFSDSEQHLSSFGKNASSERQIFYDPSSNIASGSEFLSSTQQSPNIIVKAYCRDLITSDSFLKENSLSCESSLISSDPNLQFGRLKDDLDNTSTESLVSASSVINDDSEKKNSPCEMLINLEESVLHTQCANFSQFGECDKVSTAEISLISAVDLKVCDTLHSNETDVLLVVPSEISADKQDVERLDSSFNLDISADSCTQQISGIMRENLASMVSDLSMQGVDSPIDQSEFPIPTQSDSKNNLGGHLPCIIADDFSVDTFSSKTQHSDSVEDIVSSNPNNCDDTISDVGHAVFKVMCEKDSSKSNNDDLFVTDAVASSEPDGEISKLETDSTAEVTFTSADPKICGEPKANLPSDVFNYNTRISYTSKSHSDILISFSPVAVAEGLEAKPQNDINIPGGSCENLAGNEVYNSFIVSEDSRTDELECRLIKEDEYDTALSELPDFLENEHPDLYPCENCADDDAKKPIGEQQYITSFPETYDSFCDSMNENICIDVNDQTCSKNESPNDSDEVEKHCVYSLKDNCTISQTEKQVVIPTQFNERPSISHIETDQNDFPQAKPLIRTEVKSELESSEANILLPPYKTLSEKSFNGPLVTDIMNHKDTQNELEKRFVDAIASLNDETNDLSKYKETLTELSRNIGNLWDGIVMCLLGIMKRKDDELSECANHKNNIMKERNQAVEDIQNVEKAFSELLCRYQKSKAVLESMKMNTTHQKQLVEQLSSELMEQEEKYNLLQTVTEEKLNEANEVLIKVMKDKEAEKAALGAMIRKAEIKARSLSTTLEQVENDNKELANMCEEFRMKNTEQ